ncbi:hypothetical protein PUN28_011528 [Cardiocondyla obscurior]|uniref:Uncharacterized protein n=1 Tax=Cardiocondyla obscurior TaxID=286306 RepID=A0AAW2FJW0_9HYME
MRSARRCISAAPRRGLVNRISYKYIERKSEEILINRKESRFHIAHLHMRTIPLINTSCLKILIFNFRRATASGSLVDSCNSCRDKIKERKKEGKKGKKNKNRRKKKEH